MMLKKLINTILVPIKIKPVLSQVQGKTYYGGINIGQYTL